ncbi:FliH/SctL family protein [Frondihabitans australicus]|uniref:Flagellar assembly protein FliH n=1 Tax=Frondihabitans australicus TaxID=386892 RepID=A0A495IHV9_9MICO|nr:FliH/SctL family protein [Frondihabitans australicus]RKR75567.1 flagellar assembly protein FliH [Frondihabitans australicus]
MSSAPAFARVAFPVLRDPATQAREEEAAERGHAAGYAAGLRAAAASTASLRESLEAETRAVTSHANARADRASQVLVTAAAALDTARENLRTEVQETLVETALALAEAILGYEIRTNQSSTVLAALARALDTPEAANVVAVRLNPDDLSVLPSDASESLGVPLLADGSLGRGDARADLPRGFVDAALGSALERARVALLGPGVSAAPATDAASHAGGLA